MVKISRETMELRENKMRQLLINNPDKSARELNIMFKATEANAMRLNKIYQLKRELELMKKNEMFNDSQQSKIEE